MILRNWLAKWTSSFPRSRKTSRRNRQSNLSFPQQLEFRTLLTANSFTQQTGANNPLNGVSVGFNPNPTLGDLDGDGDLDLISSEYYGTYKYYRNTGTTTAPVYTEQTGANNPLNGVNTNLNSSPRLGDLDGDGDLDLIVVNRYGTFQYFRNTGTTTAPVFTSQSGSNNPLDGVYVGTYVQTTLGDLDGDGDLDLIAGNGNGSFKYLRNTGTSTAPAFTEQTGANNPLNGFDGGTYASPALADLDGDGDLDIVSGGIAGTFKYFLNTGTSSAPVFTEQTGTDNPLNGFDAGMITNPALGDLDGDGDLDVVLGEYSTGEFYYYRNSGLPTNIGLSNNSVAENSASGTTIGTLSSTDLNSGNTFTYTLVTGTGSTDNASFSIVGNELRTAASFNFESQNSYSIRVRTTDSDGGTFEKVFTIYVTDVNETPTDLSLSNNSIAENSASGSTVGTLSTTDPDSGNTFTYTLVSGTGSTDNASFSIVGNELRTAASFNFESKSSYSIRVRATDQGNLTFDKVFTVNVTDVNEAPVLASGYFPQLPDWWMKSDTNPGETVANIISSVSPNTLITESDSGGLKGFAVIGASNPNGTWQYSTNGGSSWNSLADTSTTNARLLNTSAKLRFVPSVKKFNGDVTLTIVAWDQTSGTNGSTANVTTRGGSTAFSQASTQVKQTVLKKKPKT